MDEILNVYLIQLRICNISVKAARCHFYQNADYICQSYWYLSHAIFSTLITPYIFDMKYFNGNIIHKIITQYLLESCICLHHLVLAICDFRNITSCQITDINVVSSADYSLQFLHLKVFWIKFYIPIKRMNCSSNRQSNPIQSNTFNSFYTHQHME